MRDFTLSKPIQGNYRMDKRIGDVDYYFREFHNLDTFYDVVCIDEGISNYSSHKRDREKFTGTNNFDEAVKLARYGWEDGLKKLEYYEEMADKDYASKVADNVWDVENQVTGSYVDVGAYLQGVPECMCDFVSKRTNTFADVLVNPTISCWVKGQTIIDRGREIMKLVDALEKRHIKTRVSLMTFVRGEDGDNKCYIVNVVCKDYCELLDQNRLIFALAHPSFPRRLMFSMMEQETDIREDFGCPYGGYGRPGTIKSLPEEIWKEGLENTYTFIFDDINHTKEDVKEVKKRVEEIVRGGR